MDERRCALCGMRYLNQTLESQHYVTVDVVKNPEGEMLGGLEKHHTLYLCEKCHWNFAGKQTSILKLLAFPLSIWLIFAFANPDLAWFVAAWIAGIFILQRIVKQYSRRSTQSKLQKIAATRHGRSGPLRVFTLKQFEKFQARKKGVDENMPGFLPAVRNLWLPRGKKIDLGFYTQEDYFLPDDDDDFTQYQEKGEESQRSGD